MTTKILRSIRIFTLVIFAASVILGASQDLAVGYEAAMINPALKTQRLVQERRADQISRQLERLAQLVNQESFRSSRREPVLAQTRSLPRPTPPPTVSEAELFAALSTYRQAHQKNPLVQEESLCRYARSRVREHHLRLETLAEGENPLDNHAGFQRDASSGLLFESTGMKTIAENLAFLPEYTTATQIIEWGWDSSSDHRDAQLSNNWTHVCLSGEYPFYVGIFGRR